MDLVAGNVPQRRWIEYIHRNRWAREIKCKCKSIADYKSGFCGEVNLDDWASGRALCDDLAKTRKSIRQANSDIEQSIRML